MSTPQIDYVEVLMDWSETTERISRASVANIGWHFFTFIAEDAYAEIGVAPMNGYFASRAAPFGDTPAEVIVALLYNYHPRRVLPAIAEMRANTTPRAVIGVRDKKIVAGYEKHVPDTIDAIAAQAPSLWEAAAACSDGGRGASAAYRALPVPDHPLLRSFYAMQIVREWRGEGHYAILNSEGIDPQAACLLWAAWLRHDPIETQLVAHGYNEEEIAAAYQHLQERGFAAERQVNREGLLFRQHIEDKTNELAEVPWRAIGAKQAADVLNALDAPAATFVTLIDAMTGSQQFMPAAREHERIS